MRGLARELAVLPRLAPVLPLPIPVPLLQGEPTDGYPWPYFGFRLVPGREAALSGLDDAARVRLGTSARDVPSRVARPRRRGRGGHRGSGRPARPRRPRPAPAPPSHGPRGAPAIEPRPAPRAVRRATRRGGGAAAGGAGGARSRRPSLTPRAGERGRQPDGRDRLGDLCLADPAVDLSVAWTLLPPAARAAFEEAYGLIDHTTRVRARMLASSLCGALAVYGHVQRLPALERESLAGLERAADG